MNISQRNRKRIVVGAAVVVVLVTLVAARVNLMTDPTLAIRDPDGEPGAKFFVSCHAIGPYGVPDGVDEDVSLSVEDVPGTHEFLANEEWEHISAAHWGLVQPSQQEYDAHKALVQDNISYACTQLRHNRQSQLIDIYGAGAILLGLVGLIGLVVVRERKPE